VQEKRKLFIFARIKNKGTVSRHQTHWCAVTWRQLLQRLRSAGTSKHGASGVQEIMCRGWILWNC